MYQIANIEKAKHSLEIVH